MAVVVLLLAILGLGLVTGARFQRWLRWRGLTPVEREQERLADALLRGLRRVPAGVIGQDPQSGRWFCVQRRLAVVAIGAVEGGELDVPDAIVTWYLVTRWDPRQGSGGCFAIRSPPARRSGWTLLRARTSCWILRLRQARLVWEPKSWLRCWLNSDRALG